MCVKIAAMVRDLPCGLALQAAGSRCSIRIWLMRVIGGKDLDCGSAELSVNLRLTRGHGRVPPSAWSITLGKTSGSSFASHTLSSRPEHNDPFRIVVRSGGTWGLALDKSEGAVKDKNVLSVF